MWFVSLSGAGAVQYSGVQVAKVSAEKWRVYMCVFLMGTILVFYSSAGLCVIFEIHKVCVLLSVCVAII